MKFNIAIDGPAASGKSSAADGVAEMLGLNRLNSGMLYRAVTYALLQEEKYNPENVEFINNLDFKIQNSSVLYKNSDISAFLRTEKIDNFVVEVAKLKHVRDFVHVLQSRIVNEGEKGFVVDGRDIGTVVLPNAFLKIFLTASVSNRSRRRMNQNNLTDFAAVCEELESRDRADKTRKHGPLKMADDAVLIENDDLTLDQTIKKIVKMYENKCKK